MTYKKKLIEVSLPLEAINAESAREKSIRHGHPSTLHLWWARRPLAAARAVIWSSLVDDPSSLPEQFPTEEAQTAERERLFKILERLVKWENSNNEDVLNEAKAEILKSTDGNPPALLDPFAGGGAIPLEAQRLGLEAHASDLNPVAVMINKAMIEIPPKFAGQPPVNPDSRRLMNDQWVGASGLADDVRYYGEWMKQEAFKRIGHLYPKVKVPKEQGGGEATVIAWIWARTVKCPNPACGCEMPLASSFELSKKKGKEAYVQPIIEGMNIRYEVKYGKNAPEPPKTARGKFKCVACGEPVQGEYIKAEGVAGRMGAKIMAIVAEGNNGRLYIEPNETHEKIANCPLPDWKPTGEIPRHLTGGTCVPYGLDTFDKLFTNRQLIALTTFSALVAEAQEQIKQDGGSLEYAQAVSVYLAFVVDKMADLGNSLNRWEPNAECPRQLFARQSIPMVWDYAEGNPFSNSSGSWNVFIKNLMRSFSSNLFDFERDKLGFVRQYDAQSDNGLRNIMISTDPPYYDNIAYADLSDFFYVWLRRTLKGIYPDLFRTMLVPKTEELTAMP
jgi:putative DNA methylase